MSEWIKRKYRRSSINVVSVPECEILDPQDSEDWCCVATVYGPQARIGAALIAAAPDLQRERDALLEACKAVLALLNAGDLTYEYDVDTGSTAWSVCSVCHSDFGGHEEDCSLNLTLRNIKSAIIEAEKEPAP